MPLGFPLAVVERLDPVLRSGRCHVGQHVGRGPRTAERTTCFATYSLAQQQQGLFSRMIMSLYLLLTAAHEIEAKSGCRQLQAARKDPCRRGDWREETGVRRGVVVGVGCQGPSPCPSLSPMKQERTYMVGPGHRGPTFLSLLPLASVGPNKHHGGNGNGNGRLGPSGGMGCTCRTNQKPTP